MLTVGQIVWYNSRVWRVGLVNESRARLDPVQGNIAKLLTAEFTTYGTSVNVSAGSVLDVVNMRQLSAQEYQRTEALAHRAADSFVVVNKEETVNHEEADSGDALAPPPAPAISANKQKNQERLAALKAAVRAPVINAQAHESARPCGCDPGAGWTCAEHKTDGKLVSPPSEARSRFTSRSCLCGCGETVSHYFAQGHVNRYRNWLIKVERGEMAVEDLPVVVQRDNEFTKTDVGYVTVRNYMGWPHTGYDKKVAEKAPGRLAAEKDTKETTPHEPAAVQDRLKVLVHALVEAVFAEMRK